MTPDPRTIEERILAAIEDNYAALRGIFDKLEALEEKYMEWDKASKTFKPKARK